MTKLTLQKRLAASIMKVGKTKVWIDPDKEKQKEVQSAITRIDVKRLIKKGIIKSRPEKVSYPAPSKKKRKNRGSKKGSQFAKVSKKREWINTVRPLRKMLKELKDNERIDNKIYRKVYMLIKGGQFRSRSHMNLYLEQHRLLKEKKE